MMSMALWKKMLLKSDQFQFSPSEFYFRACGLRICDKAKDCTSRSVRPFFFLKFNPAVLLSLTILLMWIWSSQGNFCLREHVPIGGLIFDVDCRERCEVPSTQTQDNFVSDIFFQIIVTLIALFWLCKMWLFPRLVKYVIEIHVAKVALGVLHLNFL